MATLTMLGSNGHGQITFEDLRGLRTEGYIRDSKRDQIDGYGPDIQRGNIQRFAESYGLVLGNRWYTEFVTGRSVARRNAFRRFLEDANLDLYDVLLVDHTSRFGRNQGDCIHYKQDLTHLGKVVVFVSQGIISGSDRDFLAERINETLDEAYSRNLSRYVTAGLAEKVAQGHAIGHAPLGYRHLKSPSGRGAWAVPDAETMPALLALLRGYAQGNHSFRTLAQEMNARGYRTGEGKPFTESSVSTVLNNPFYSGRFYYHRNRSDEQVREGVHEVPEEARSLWERCQQLRRERAGPGRHSPPCRQQRVYPLTGILVCDGCGEPFHGITCHSHGGSFGRMVHSWRRCSMRPLSVGAPRIERDLAAKVLGCLHLDDGWKEAVLRAMAREGQQPDHTLEQRRIEVALANLRKQHIWGVIGDDEFKTDYQALDRQRRALATPPPSVLTPNLDRAAELLRDLPALWQHPGVELRQKRELARDVFQEIRLREGQLVAVRPRTAYIPLFAYSLWRQNVVGDPRSP